jgi:hypothetical protein
MKNLFCQMSFQLNQNKPEKLFSPTLRSRVKYGKQPLVEMQRNTLWFDFSQNAELINLHLFTITSTKVDWLAPSNVTY